MSWQSINQEVSEQWWENAYKLFLENDPLRTIIRHLLYYLSNNTWNDYGFDIQTLLPPAAAGFFKHVDKRAILVVISRRRNMDYNNWKSLHPAQTEPEDLDDNDKSLINQAITQMYKEDGSPKPLNRE